MLTRVWVVIVGAVLVLTALAAPTPASPASTATSTGQASQRHQDPPRRRGELPRNRWSGPAGTATMHGDPGSSDTTPLRGPGATPQAVQHVVLPGVCPTILAGRDGVPLALCTEYADRAPSVYLLDPTTYLPLARLHLQAGALLGGVYAYVDHRDRLVTVDGSGAIVLVAHDENGPAGTDRLFVQRRIPFTRAISRLCGSTSCDSLVSVAPGYDGRIWFATAHAAAGYADPRTGRVVVRRLGSRQELIGNSISTAPDGTVVTTDRATYLLRADGRGRVRQLWRRGYDRGSARKPGQLTQGSGATPTFFGPRTGHEFVAITDNARPRSRVLVYRTSTGALRCSLPVLARDNSGSENSPIAFRRSIYVASTYGYPYPAGTTGTSDPASAPFVGGLERVDLTRRGCRSVWRTRTRSSAVPRLSTAEGVIHTVTRSASLAYDLVRISPRDGRVVSRSRIGNGPTADTLQMVGSILADGTLLQGNIAGLTVTRR
ncbi:hypothetical protein [Nocardioides sp.]|uniref:hypothetical protein n=1 Tax=Nocardioides sp. TaxID=35761 RepID=UPI00271C38BD|nr:hypothetical protein [Nocardioides sp.]MDO9456928.1 hypothetical protein [Nocardioides sp.]